MDAPNRKIAQLYADGLAYEAVGDSYLAIKLFKKIIRLDKHWAPAYARLGAIYKARAEWKPALYYCKKTLALDPAQADSWWALGISATALKKRGIAKSVWSKFGLDHFKTSGPICIRLQYQKQMEILWVRPIDPARGEIINIPHPNSDRRYRDIILYDREVIGHNVVGRRRVPIMQELSRYKRSGFRTFSCSLYTQEEKHLQSLERLCLEHGLGFEIWSNSTQQLIPASQQVSPEYFSRDMLPTTPGKACIAAFGAYEMVDVQTVLESWRVVSLQRYGEVQRY
jgi:tetratricopeptide (TPR) repeat protein